MLLALFFLFSSLGAAAAPQPAPAAAPASARFWEETPAEYEAYLRSAQVVKMTSATQMWPGAPLAAPPA